MKVFVTGVNGQLGYDCMNELINRGYECIGSDIQDFSKNFSNYISLDITNKWLVNKIINKIKPDVVIHCAAYTNVDLAENDNRKNEVENINVNGTLNLAIACKENNSKMLYLSTDYVFNNCSNSPLDPDSIDYNPINFYGRTKLYGELIVSNILNKYFIVRISWVFGINGKNFINTMLNLGRINDEVKVVNDQIGTPTYTYDLSRLLVDMIETDKYGYYHASNEGGYISWYDFTIEIYKQIGLKTKVIPVTTFEYGLNKANRPFNSRLDKSKLIANGFNPLPVWKDALIRYLEQCNYKLNL